MPLRILGNICIFITISIITLAGCSEDKQPIAVEEAPTATANETVKTTPLEAPPGQLNENVAPQHYALELRIDPSQDTFSGSVTIDITLGTAVDSIWIHGKNLDVSEVWLTMADSSRVEATYKQQLESGVAQISFAKTVSAGNASLHFNYSAAFNTSVNALFKVTRGEESYVASQFEPTGARQSFTGLPMTKPAHNDGLPVSVRSVTAPCTRVV